MTRQTIPTLPTLPQSLFLDTKDTEMNKQLIKQIRKLCEKFENDLQTLLDDSEMDNETYESDVVSAAVQAQFSAKEARECD